MEGWDIQFAVACSIVSYHCCAFILINENGLIGDAAFLNVDIHLLLLHISAAHSGNHN
jgi:hypothetical protein